MDKQTCYVLVRRDIPPVQRAVQAAHAALQAGFGRPAPKRPPHLVLLEVPGERHLLDWSLRLTDLGIGHELFYEPDYAMGHSALATEPVGDGRLFRKLKLASMV